jgi:hypothetical protein
MAQKLNTCNIDQGIFSWVLDVNGHIIGMLDNVGNFSSHVQAWTSVGAFTAAKAAVTAAGFTWPAGSIGAVYDSTGQTLQGFVDGDGNFYPASNKVTPQVVSENKDISVAANWNKNPQPLLTYNATTAPVVSAGRLVKTDRFSSPLDNYYLYCATDHAASNTTSGAFLYTAPTPMGPFTYYGHVFEDLSTAGNFQTENLSFFWDKVVGTSGALRMWYKVYTASVQMLLCSATSIDGITWTRDTAANTYFTQIDASQLGDGSVGYFYPSQTKNGYMAYSIYGSGVLNICVKWENQGNLGQWFTDRMPMGYGLEYTTPTGWITALQGGSTLWKVEWNGVGIIESGGIEYAIGNLSNGAYAGQTGINSIFAAKISDDYRHLTENPATNLIWNPVNLLSWETGDLRGNSLYVENGIVYNYYAVTLNATTHSSAYMGVMTYVL